MRNKVIIYCFILALIFFAATGFVLGLDEEVAKKSILSELKPGIVFTFDQIDHMGYTETSRIIQYILPSFNSSVSTVSDGSDFVRPATLRGMQPDQVLVLINGKRRHNSALLHVNGSVGRGTSGVDLNVIPVAAIDRIEVLQDSASSRYGSDAVAGVINIILKTDKESTSVGLFGGQTFQSDGETLSGSVFHGLSIGQGGFFNLSAQYRYGGFTNRAGEDPRRIYNYLEQVYGMPGLSSGTLDPREETYDTLNHRYGEPKSQDMFFFVNSEIPVSDRAQFYLFGGISNTQREAGLFNRLPNQGRTNIILFPDGHMPLMTGGITDGSLGFGYRMEFSNWELDAGLSGGLNRFVFDMANSANTSLGGTSPTEAELGALQYAQSAFTLDLTGSASVGMASPLDIGLGLEVRSENYQIDQGDLTSWVDGGVPDQFGGIAPAGMQGFPGFRPSNEVSESRLILGLYGNLEIAPIEEIQIGLSSRFDQYKDLGGNFSGKAALGFTPVDGILLRGSVSSGFRAPSLQQMYFNNSSTQFVLEGDSLVPMTVGTFNSLSGVSTALGFPELEAERFSALTAGLDLTPKENLAIHATLYMVDVKDRIIISGFLRASDPLIAPLLAPFGVNAAQVLTNAVDTNTFGVDVSLSWTIPFSDDHHLSLMALGNWNKTEISGDPIVPSSLEGYQDIILNRIERNYIEYGQPQQRVMLRSSYVNGGFFGELRFNYFGGVTTVESNTNSSTDQIFSGKWITDLELSYEILKGVRIAAGASNLFDVYPDESQTSISFNGIFPYPRRNAPFGFMGGSYYARLNFGF